MDVATATDGVTDEAIMSGALDQVFEPILGQVGMDGDEHVLKPESLHIFFRAHLHQNLGERNLALAGNMGDGQTHAVAEGDE
jgi:hypothetical protein